MNDYLKLYQIMSIFSSILPKLFLKVNGIQRLQTLQFMIMWLNDISYSLPTIVEYFLKK